MNRVIALVHLLRAKDDGQDLIEYGLLVMLIALIAIVAVTRHGTTVDAILWQAIAPAI